MKPGNTPQYTNQDSNHPPTILRTVPQAMNKRLSSTSSDKQSFDAAIPPYQEALRQNGYKYTLEYNPQPPKHKRSRKRNIIWFNPPYNCKVATNIGHKFLQAIDDCFRPTHPLHKILNRNTLKLSYSCMLNVHCIISGHNKKIRNKLLQTDALSRSQHVSRAADASRSHVSTMVQPRAVRLQKTLYFL